MDGYLKRYPVPFMTQVAIVPLGGVAEIGKNCTAVIQGDDMVLVDCGISFPTNEEPGVDVVIPDFTFIEENIDKLRGVLITHAHEDHIGALPYFLKRFNVPVFATEFTHAMIRRKVDEKLDVRELHLVTI
jgi:ribonuclease J